MNVFLVVWPAEAKWLMSDYGVIGRCLDEGDIFYAIDGNVCFVKTAQDLQALTTRLSAEFGETEFFVVSADKTSRSGNMKPSLWQFLRGEQAIEVAA